MTPLGQIKLEVMARGVVPDDGVRRAAIQGISGAAELKEVSFALAEDFFISSRIGKPGSDAFPLSWQNGGPVLHISGSSQPVGLLPRPKFFHQLQTSSGAVTGDVSLDGYCINIYIKALPQENKLSREESQVLSWVRSAFDEGSACFVQINMDYCESPDRGFHLLEPLVRAVKKNFRTFVALRGFAPEDLSVLDRVYASGVDVLILPLEGFSRSAQLEEIMPSEHGHRALEYAAGVFPQGSIMTELNYDASQLDLLYNKIDLLTQKNILPFLILPTDGLLKEDYEAFRDVVEQLEQSAARQRLPLKWLFPSVRHASALDTGFYTQAPEKAKLAQRPIYKSTFGKTASEGFAALRRALRVKNISDSYESSGL